MRTSFSHLTLRIPMQAKTSVTRTNELGDLSARVLKSALQVLETYQWRYVAFC